MLCSSSHRITPIAASSPYALPPDSVIALTICTLFTGLSTSVSRVPGAPPRTSTPPVVSSFTMMAVQPVGRSVSVKCPTFTPSTAVIVMLPPLTEFVAAAGGGDTLRDCASMPADAATVADNDARRIVNFINAPLVGADLCVGPGADT